MLLLLPHRAYTAIAKGSWVGDEEKTYTYVLRMYQRESMEYEVGYSPPATELLIGYVHTPVAPVV